MFAIAKLAVFFTAAVTADVMIGMAEFLTGLIGDPADDRRSRVLMADGHPPVAVRGTQSEIYGASLDLARRTKGSVMILEPVEIVTVASHQPPSNRN